MIIALYNITLINNTSMLFVKIINYNSENKQHFIAIENEISNISLEIKAELISMSN